MAAWGLALVAAVSAEGVGQGTAAAASSPRESPCTLTATADRTDVAIGEPFSVEVNGVGPAGAVWAFAREASSDTVDLRAINPATGGLAAGTWRYMAAAFAIGETQVPAIEAKCRLADGSEHVARSAPLTLRMVSVLPKDPAEQQLADIRPPLALRAARAFWAALATVLVLCGAAAYVLWRGLRRRQMPVVEATLSADAEARAALARLAAESWLGHGEYRAFYIALTQIAKRYLERRLSAPVLEMTSSETVGFLRHDARAQGWASSMRDLTAAADRVKFAAGVARADEAERHLHATAEMIDALEAAMRPVDAAAGDKAA